jgi:hypothetical protein
MKNLYKYEFNLGYGIIAGIFTATPEEVELVFRTPLEIYLGEVLGKRSEVAVTVRKGTLKEIPSDIIPEDQLHLYCTGYDLLNCVIAPHLDELRFMDPGERLFYLKDNEIEHLSEYLLGQL